MFQVQFIVTPSQVVVREMLDNLDEVVQLLSEYPSYEGLAIVKNGWLWTFAEMTPIQLEAMDR